MRHCLSLLAGLALAIMVQAQDAPPAAEPPRFVRGQADTEAGPARRQAHVELDEDTRTLIITTDAATNAQIMQVIDALDRPVPQALIKVLFLEVTHNDDLDVGVDAKYSYTDSTGDSALLSSLFGVSSETRGGIVTILQNDLEVTLRAIAEVGRLNVLSRPSVLARNNQEATITIGKEVPFIRNSRITTDGQILNTVEYEDIGIILTVTPRIGADGLIELDIAPEISTLTGETVPISDTVNAPVFAKRSATTNVIVPSGRTVVIGGLMEDQETKTVRKVPILGSIPLIGFFFRRTVTTKDKTELLIFVTPTVVDSSDGLVDLTKHEHDSTEAIRQEINPEQLRRYLGADSPAAPPAAAEPIETPRP